MKNRLKVLRAERDWTQAQLADALDVSRQTINAIEKGKFDPSLPLAFRAARLFGLRIEEIFHERDDLEGEALASLIDAGILRHEKSKLLWIIDVERFPLVDNRPQQHVRLRLANTILSDRIPETRDIMLVSIAEPCGLLPYVLSEDTLGLRRARVQLLCNMETISRKVADAIVRLEVMLRQAMAKVV